MPFWTGTHWEAEEPPAPQAKPGRIRHVAEALTEATMVAVLVVGAIAGSAFAAGGKQDSSVWIDGLTSARTSGLAYGSAFTVGYTTSARQPWAYARCYPNDSTVYRETYGDGWVWGEYFSVYAGGPQPQAFQLIDPIAQNWTSGGADCVLELLKYSTDYSRYTVLARSTFTVVP